MIKRLRFILAYLLIPLAGFAQFDDTQIWMGAALKKKLSEKWNATAETQVRFDRNANRFRGAYYSFEADRKLTEGLKLLTEIRYSTSIRWDRIRLGAGLEYRKKIKGIRFSNRLLYQYQFVVGLNPRFGSTASVHNLRYRLKAEDKLFKKTFWYAFVEPQFRFVQPSFFFHRTRFSLGVKRNLKGPFVLETGLIVQTNHAERRTAAIWTTEFTWEWKNAPKKPKANTFSPSQ